MSNYFHDIKNAIRALHYLHGKGDIKAIRLFADGRIEVDAQCTSSKVHTRRGHVVSNGHKQTIRLLRHQLTVTNRR